MTGTEVLVPTHRRLRQTRKIKTCGLCNITMVVTQPDLVASQQLHTTQTNNIPGMISVALLLAKYSNICPRERKGRNHHKLQQSPYFLQEEDGRGPTQKTHKCWRHALVPLVVAGGPAEGQP